MKYSMKADERQRNKIIKNQNISIYNTHLPLTRRTNYSKNNKRNLK